MKIAILGTRGVPPRYGGFETFAAELGKRLAARGHEVAVYCRGALYPDATPAWEGVRRIDLPAIRHKYLETVSHALLSAFHAVGEEWDAILVCNAANAFVLPILRAARIPVAINVDGVERKRKKWNALGRFVYVAGETLSVHFSDVVVADAQVIADYYRDRHGVAAELIAYGSEIGDGGESEVLQRLGLERRRYILYVSRFEPENHPLEVVEAYGRVETEVPLVMVGDAPYSSDLIGRVRAAADPRVILPGALYGADYENLQQNALVYIQATEVGGTHPALIEAMASGGAVLVNDTPENREVAGDAAIYFTFGSRRPLRDVLDGVLDGSVDLEGSREAARRRACSRYGWEGVVDAYEALFRRIAR